MHYEDLIIKDIIRDNNFWYAVLESEPGSLFQFPVANSSVSEEELIKNNIILGASLLGVVQGDKLVALNNFSFIHANSRGI